ncbi:hypothetical protein KKC87_02255, partial [Patescibacteria group bacterium]|nr:hypothetical protein [Patescibacteria group bacterium]
MTISRKGEGEGQMVPTPEGNERQQEGNNSDIISTTMGEHLGWTEGVTMHVERINNVELLGVTAFDTKFTNLHNRVSSILEANASLAHRLKTKATIAQIYHDIDHGRSILVTRADGEKVDLRHLARFVEMKKLNLFMGKYKISDDVLEDKFFNNEAIEVTLENGRMIDFWKACPLDDLEGFDFDEYMRKIKKNQPGLQWMGGLKADAQAKKHVENAGHAQFVETHEVDPETGNAIYLWVPVSETMSIANARGDVPKDNARSRAGGHVHEVGWYNEDTGVTVKFDPKLLEIHRSGIDIRSHEATNKRMWNASIGLNQYEQASILSNQVVEGQTLNVLCIGGAEREGAVYKALKGSYDKTMKKVRGYGLLDDEADDMILTDIIAPFILNDQLDWTMCLAKAAGSTLSYGKTQAYSQDGGNWAKTFKFCIRIRCKDIETGNVRKQDFFSMDELIQYINKRVKNGDISGVNRSKQLKEFKGLTPEQVRQQEEDYESMMKDGSLKQFERKIEDSNVRIYARIFKRIFGEKADEAAQEYMDNGSKAKFSAEGTPMDMLEYVKKNVQKWDFRKPDDFKDLVTATGEIF